eukprot:CAMPEP_0182566728 /NCGR_PEP_ID=MMETSP1324-20130603/8110_1 /TAXON_ID=236786 /ORGANISM="Florenciella sp., Strain RCC1587" /LENGTH=115 /DNA_ID=CAMNT_0024780575 /DNA_START=524 /DNA_END=868 /DNA_ORIENTATION=+
MSHWLIIASGLNAPGTCLFLAWHSLAMAWIDDSRVSLPFAPPSDPLPSSPAPLTAPLPPLPPLPSAFALPPSDLAFDLPPLARVASARSCSSSTAWRRSPSARIAIESNSALDIW